MTQPEVEGDHVKRTAAAWNARVVPDGYVLVPNGYVLVPRVPTEAMVVAIWRATLGGTLRSAENVALAMLAAAPFTPVAGEG